MMRKWNLQVGDYVLIDGKPRKIAAVHQRKVGWHLHPHKLEWTRISLIEPIPLTSEILRVNGCREYRPNKVFRLREFNGDAFDCIEIHFSYVTGETSIVVVEHGDENSVIRRFSIGGCVYVHELQDALRLCGIDREIELNLE